LQIRPIVFIAMLLVVMATLGALGLSSTTGDTGIYASPASAGSDAVGRANLEFARAVAAVREAEVAGADEDQLRVLVEQLNSIVWMIERAEHLLLQGDVEGASAQAERSVEASKGVVLQAEQLREVASERTYFGKVFTFALVPVASLLVTVGAHYGWRWWRRREIDRMMRMEIREVKEPKEET